MGNPQFPMSYKIVRSQLHKYVHKIVNAGVILVLLNICSEQFCFCASLSAEIYAAAGVVRCQVNEE